MNIKNDILTAYSHPDIFRVLTGRLSLLAVLVVLVPFSLTFYTWKMASDAAFERSQSQFEILAMETEKSLINRLNSYHHALLGAAGFLQGSEEVRYEDWLEYVNEVKVGENFPGVSGLGIIVPIEAKDIDSFVEKSRKDISPTFRIYPETEGLPYYINTFFGPQTADGIATGLNLAFEDKRREAAEFARDSGKATVTGAVTLVRRYRDQTGFILFYPLYEKDVPLNTVEERKAAFKHWVYAPFNVTNFFKTVNDGKGGMITMSVYDETLSPDRLIYSDGVERDQSYTPQYRVTKTLEIMQRNWIVVWESTPAFENQNDNEGMILILVGGLAFTGLLAVFLFTTAVQNAELMERIGGGERQLNLPVVIFIITSIGVFGFYHVLSEREIAYIHGTVVDEARKIEESVAYQTDGKLMSVGRMAQRWLAVGGTPEDAWRADARNHATQISGLKTVEWVGTDYRIAMAEPAEDNKDIIGLYVRYEDIRKKAIDMAVSQNIMTITPPLELYEGGQAFFAYAPVIDVNTFHGLVVGVFSIEKLFRAIIPADVAAKYGITAYYEGEPFFTMKPHGDLRYDFSVNSNVTILDKKWVIELTPTHAFMSAQRSLLPMTLLVAGLLIAVLLALTVHYVLISRLRSHYLKMSEETFRDAIKNAPIPMALLSVTGKWLNVNQSLCDYFGYTEAELLRTGYQRIAHPEDLPEDMGYIENMISGRKQSYHVERRYVHKNGHIIWGVMNVSLGRNADGTPKHFILQILDITERHKMEQMKRDFISVVSHELRTPLTSIRGSLGLIEGTMTESLPQKVNHLIAIAHKNCEKLILLINDILDLDKITAGKMRFRMADENLADLIRQGIESNKAYGDKFNVRFVQADYPDDIIVHVDADRWQQVMTNLLSNAAKFSPVGGTVTISATVNDHWARVSVHDKGQGITPEFSKRIFEKFSQADTTSTRTKDGTGLGLNISMQIVKKMNGRIGFDSEQGKGSVFWFEFPVTSSESESVASGDIVAPIANGRIKILHVEDDPDLVQILETALADKGVLPIAAVSVKEAKQKLHDHEFALIVLDMNLKDGSGLSLLDDVTAMENPVPVIILSAEEPAEDLLHKVESVLVKSYVSEQVIIDTILSYVDGEVQKGEYK